ncbi:MAG: beta-lactamase family protein, partial [Brevundimonas sp.]|nr:beta-lactamase family protein [Brevundimonas sp.]
MASLIAVCGLLTPTPSHAQTSAPVVADLVRTYATTNAFSGTVLVDQGGETLVFESFGPAERAFGTPAKNDTRYRIASVTKLFTAALILQLVDRGQVDLQAPVATYLPDYRGDPRITVHTLLNHTSGLPNPDAGADPTKGVPLYQLPHTPDELVREYASGAAVHDPGTAWDYNNADYFVLGRIIETVTGQPYADALKQRILDPLGLRDTGMLRYSDIVPGLAASYFRMGDDQPLGADLPVYPENWFAAGAMYSDADDLL